MGPETQHTSVLKHNNLRARSFIPKHTIRKEGKTKTKHIVHVFTSE